MYRDHYPPPQTPWEAINQPRHVYSAYPAAAHELLEPRSTFSRYPAAAYLTSAVRQSAMAPLRTFLTATQDEKAAIGADPEMVAALGLGAGFLLVIAAANIAGAYFAGRAMAPTKQERNSYGIGTAVANAFLGPLGFLGAAGYSISNQRLPVLSYEIAYPGLNGLGAFGAAMDVPPCSGLPPEYRGNCILPTGAAIPSCNGSLMPCWSTLSNKVLNTPEAGSTGRLPSPPITGTSLPVDGATGCAAGGMLGLVGGGLLLGVPLGLGAALLGAVLSDADGAWWKWGGLTFVGVTVLSGIAGCSGGVNAVDDAYKTGAIRPAGA